MPGGYKLRKRQTEVRQKKGIRRWREIKKRTRGLH